MSDCEKKFITEQLVENSTSMRIHICNELLVIHISSSLWPAEQRLNRRIEDLITFHEFKSRQFEEGEYGICVICRKKIPRERLEVVPHTQHCASCKN